MLDTLNTYIDEYTFDKFDFEKFDDLGEDGIDPTPAAEAVNRIVKAIVDSSDTHIVDVLAMAASKGSWCVRHEALRCLQEMTGHNELAAHARNALVKFKRDQLPQLPDLIRATYKNLPPIVGGWSSDSGRVVSKQFGATMLLALFPEFVTAESSAFKALKSALRIIQPDDDFIRDNIVEGYGLGIIWSAAEVLIAAGHRAHVARAIEKWACCHWLGTDRPVELLKKCGECPSQAALEERRRVDAEESSKRWEEDRQRVAKQRVKDRRRRDGCKYGYHNWQMTGRLENSRRIDSYEFTCARCGIRRTEKAREVPISWEWMNDVPYGSSRG